MIRWRRTVVALAAITALAVPAGPVTASTPAASPAPNTATPASAVAPAATATAAAASEQVLMYRLSIPWGIAPLGDGSALVTERNTGRIWLVRPAQQPRLMYTVTDTRPAGEGGLLGIAKDPDYAHNKLVYVYYTTVSDNRVSRIKIGSTARPVPIITGIPKGTIHNGGGLYYHPRGYLYVGTGETGNRDLAQDPNSLGGKVLRVTGTGAPAPGNRWGRVWTIGHRNVQDLTIDATGTRVWASELGQDTHDEVNLLVGGGNYGWPICEGVCSDSRFRDPKWTWAPVDASPSGITFAGPDLFVGALRGARVWRLTVSGDTITGATPTLVNTYGRIRGVQGMDGNSLWIMTSNGNGTDRIIRLQPPPTG